MRRFHYRIYTGPCTVGKVADRLRAAAEPGQAVAIEGTEHVYFVVMTPFQQDAADAEVLAWFGRACLTSLLVPSRLPGLHTLRSEAVGGL